LAAIDSMVAIDSMAAFSISPLQETLLLVDFGGRLMDNCLKSPRKKILLQHKVRHLVFKNYMPL